MTDPLFVDTYVGDRHGDVLTLMNMHYPWCGLIHKLSQGTYHDESSRVLQFRQSILDHPRYGEDFFDGDYHYYDFTIDPVEQADFYWRAMTRIGGEKKGTLWAMVDVERGGQRMIPHRDEVFEQIATFAERYQDHSGRLPTLYGGELLRSLDIHKPGSPINLLGCGRNTIAAYGPTLTKQVIEMTGTDPDHLLFWQYDGDGEAYLKDYPREAPGFGKIDISVLTLPGGLAALKEQLWQKT